MDDRAKHAARWATEQSDAEAVTFPEVVQAMFAAGVERYVADLVASTKTYYAPDDTFEILPCDAVGPVGMDFDAAGVEAAVRAIQGGSIKYRAFCRRIAAAGCVGYWVSMVGRRAVYYGRTGETHIERFPQAK